MLSTKGKGDSVRTTTWFYIRRGIIIVPARLYRSAGTALKNAVDLQRALHLKSIVVPDLHKRRNRDKPAT